jgi:pilus assembly protein CpaE
MMKDAQLNQLLPACSLTLFSANGETRAAFEALATDWRCANLTLATQKGGIADAQKYYTQHPSPDLLIVETQETKTESLIAALENLAAHCADNTAAILIGPENDVDLYRRLTRMGVLDYLVAPITTDRLLDVVAGAVLERFGIASNDMVVVLGSRGGAGTTSIASLIAWGVAQSGRKTALCDLLPGRSPLPVLWGVECPGGLADLGKAFKAGDIDNLYRLCPKANDALHLFTPATDTPFDFALGHDEQAALLQGLRQHFPMLVYDTAGFTPKMLKTLIPTAPHVFLVTPPTVSGLRSTRKLLSQIEPLRGHSGAIKIVLNRCKEFNEELGRKDVEAALGVAPALEIAYDKTLAGKIESGTWREYAPAQGIANSLLRLMGAHGTDAKTTPKKGGMLKWLGLEE